MSSHKSAAVAVDLAVLESQAIAAVKAIDSGYSAASKAIMAYVLGAKRSGATPPVFESGMARISDAIPGIAKITVGAYVSNARRIFAASKDALDKALSAAGSDSIKALAAACPAVSKTKAEGQQKRAAAAAAPTEPSAPKASTPASDPMLAITNDLVALRKLAANKKKAKLILAAIGEIEDMLDDVKSMLAA